MKWSVPDAHPNSRVLSILKFCGLFEICMRGIFYSLKDTLLFKFSEFLSLWSFWCGLDQIHIQMIESGIFRNRAQTVSDSKLCRKFHFFLRFCTRKRSETYIYVSLCLCVQNAVSAQPCVGKFRISLVLLNFCIVILDYGLKLHKLSIHTLVMLQKWLEIH